MGLDHTNILGDTIDKIAWQKAGIMKSTAKAFTVNQNETAMMILKERSVERNVCESSLQSTKNLIIIYYSVL